MNVIFILIAVSLLVAVGFLISFIWSIRNGQFDDEYTPSVRILFDDETKHVKEEESTQQGSTKFQAPNTKQKAKSKSEISNSLNLEI